jgi:hypothetical protein
MRSDAIIIVGVGFQDSTQMHLAQDNDVVHTLTPLNRSHFSLQYRLSNSQGAYMVALLSGATVGAFSIGLVGIVLSFVFKDWMWFARSGCLIAILGLNLFFQNESRFTRYFKKATGIDLGAPNGQDELSARIEKYRTQEGVGTTLPDYSFEESLFRLGNVAFAVERRIATIGAIIWGFGDLPQKLY